MLIRQTTEGLFQGYCIAVTLAKSVVSWSSSTQGVTALSTAQAGYVATGDGVKERLLVKSALSFIVPPLSEML